MAREPVLVLAIGGSDPSGGAGIQADLKAIHANGGYALTVVTAITAQSGRGVAQADPVEPAQVRAQLRALREGRAPGAIKTGMLATAAIVAAVAEELAAWPDVPLVVDPVVLASSGARLLSEDGVAALRRHLLPRAMVCTPNGPEAALLAGCPVTTLEDAERAARRIQRLGPRAVLVKGGHLQDARGVDLLFDGERAERVGVPPVAAGPVHGTGCTLAAALATALAQGLDLRAAVRRAKEYLRATLAGARSIGPGAAMPGSAGGEESRR